jgi:hypothetical protein
MIPELDGYGVVTALRKELLTASNYYLYFSNC